MRYDHVNTVNNLHKLNLQQDTSGWKFSVVKSGLERSAYRTKSYGSEQSEIQYSV